MSILITFFSTYSNTINVCSSQNYRFLDVDKFDHSSEGSRFVLSRLRKHCQYEIVVQAINVYGEGPLAKPSLGRTMEDVPDGPPEKVHCVALTSATIQVSWHPPEIHLRNGIIKGYKVSTTPGFATLKFTRALSNPAKFDFLCRKRNHGRSSRKNIVFTGPLRSAPGSRTLAQPPRAQDFPT
jgi:hypothetical protein